MRKRTPLVVETLRDQASGRTIEITMDWESKKFIADPKDGREPVEHAEHAVVREMAYKLLKTSFVFAWRAVILIDVDDHAGQHHNSQPRGDMCATAALRFERCELALKADGMTSVQRPHELDLSEDWQVERRASGGDVETRSSWNNPDAELPYAQEAWNGLVALARVINQAHATLDGLVKTAPEKLARLASKGAPLLLAPREGKRK